MPSKVHSGLPSHEPVCVPVQCTYPVEAVEFIHRGLFYTVEKIYGGQDLIGDKTRHVSGQQLCHGLREFALEQWGLMAGTVLRRWNIHGTLDFGKIVFALVDLKMLSTTENDTLDDFKDVYDFQAAFESSYHIAGRV